MPAISKGLKQAYDVQDLAFEVLQEYRRSIVPGKVSAKDASAIAALVKSWEAAQERIRIHRMRPLPGSVRPDKPKKRQPNFKPFVPEEAKESLSEAEPSPHPAGGREDAGSPGQVYLASPSPSTQDAGSDNVYEEALELYRQES